VFFAKTWLVLSSSSISIEGKDDIEGIVLDFALHFLGTWIIDMMFERIRLSWYRSRHEVSETRFRNSWCSGMINKYLVSDHISFLGAMSRSRIFSKGRLTIRPHKIEEMFYRFVFDKCQSYTNKSGAGSTKFLQTYYIARKLFARNISLKDSISRVLPTYDPEFSIRESNFSLSVCEDSVSRLCYMHCRYR
jgi:hypothetical protein